MSVNERVSNIKADQYPQTIAKAIEEYCQKIEGLFMSEMFPARPEEADNVDEQRSAWLVKAKGLYQADKKAEPFALDPAVGTSDELITQMLIMTMLAVSSQAQQHPSSKKSPGQDVHRP